MTTPDAPALIQAGDLTVLDESIPEAKAAVLIADAIAQAGLVAPCLTDTTKLDPTQLAAAKAILRRAVLREWERIKLGSGALTSRQQTAGPFSQMEQVDNRPQRGGLLWPSEITALQSICKAVDGSTERAFSIHPTGGGALHAPWCALYFQATYCSCGSDINRYEGPIYEVG